jgi:hypothetical protein
LADWDSWDGSNESLPDIDFPTVTVALSNSSSKEIEMKQEVSTSSYKHVPNPGVKTEQTEPKLCDAFLSSKKLEEPQQHGLSNSRPLKMYTSLSSKKAASDDDDDDLPELPDFCPASQTKTTLKPTATRPLLKSFSVQDTAKPSTSKWKVSYNGVRGGGSTMRLIKSSTLSEVSCDAVSLPSLSQNSRKSLSGESGACCQGSNSPSWAMSSLSSGVPSASAGSIRYLVSQLGQRSEGERISKLLTKNTSRNSDSKPAATITSGALIADQVKCLDNLTSTSEHSLTIDIHCPADKRTPIASGSTPIASGSTSPDQNDFGPSMSKTIISAQEPSATAANRFQSLSLYGPTLSQSNTGCDTRVRQKPSATTTSGALEDDYGRGFAMPLTSISEAGPSVTAAEVPPATDKRMEMWQRLELLQAEIKKFTGTLDSKKSASPSNKDENQSTTEQGETEDDHQHEEVLPLAEPQNEDVLPLAEPRHENVLPYAERQHEEVLPLAEPQHEEVLPLAEPPEPSSVLPPEPASSVTNLPVDVTDHIVIDDSMNDRY